MTSIPDPADSRLVDALQGCVLGTAVGDSVGLPFENLSQRSVAKLMRRPLEQSLLFGKGVVSDDTEHTVMVLLSLLEAGRDAVRFRTCLAKRFRWWLSALPGWS